MFYEGVGNLFPWNAFITASSYYSNRFCQTPFETNFENYFSLSFTISQTIGLGLSVLFGHMIPLKAKIIYPLLCYSFIFIMTTIFVGVEQINPNLLFYLTLISTCCCGLCGAILSAGLYGLGAMLPQMYTAALMNGSGLGGLIVSVSAILTSFAKTTNNFCDDDTTTSSTTDCAFFVDFSALAYFLIATIILLTCITAFMYAIKHPFTLYYVARAGNGSGTKLNESSTTIMNPFIEEPFNEREKAVYNSKFDDSKSSFNIKYNADNSPGQLQRSLTSTYSANGDRILSKDHVMSNHIDDQPQLETYEKIWNVYKYIWVPSLSVWYTFTVTIGIFPSLIVLIESIDKCKNNETKNRFSNDLFVPIMFLLFNLFDFVGRVAGGIPYCTVLFNNSNIWMLSVARTVFFPLFLLCNVSNSQLPKVFNSDAFPIIFMILFAFSNGFVATCSMILGAITITDARDSALAGTIMIFSLTVGLFFGACFSFLLVYVSQGSF
eukprot:gene14708-19768_t